MARRKYWKYRSKWAYKTDYFRVSFRGICKYWY
jgi:hypothetical protein